jgi:phage terminase large subunit
MMTTLNKEKENKVGWLELMKPSPKQKLALKTIFENKYTLYGGAMYGGKSYLLRWALLGLLIYYFKKYGFEKVQAGLFCEDYPTLKTRQLAKISAEFPKWLGTRHADHKDYGNCFILDEQYGGGILMFLNLDRPEKYDSSEFAAIGVDELTKNKEQIFTVLRRRLRWTDEKSQTHIPDCKFIAGTNPGGIGHAWVKKLWMDLIYDDNEIEQTQFAYVSAKYDDNVIKNPEYESMLNSMPEKLRKAFRDGNWDTFEGQYFEQWGRAWNTCKPYKLQSNLMRFLWMDYGYSAPSSVHWAALDELGRVIVYRELYGTGMTYKALARKIQEMTPQWEQDVLQGQMIADPAIFAKKGEDEGEKSGAEQMDEATKGWLSFRRGNNDRVNGWGVMREYMKPFNLDGEITSKLIFFEGLCANAIRTIPALVYDSTRVEDLNSKGEDHCADEVRYGLMDIFELFSEKSPEAPKAVRTTDDIKKRDLLALKKEREENEEESNVDWMTM